MLTAAPEDTHFEDVVKNLRRGKLVFFLGAGVNLCGRPDGMTWTPGAYLPSGAELASHLAACFSYPEASATDLPRVAQFAAVSKSSGDLYDELDAVFEATYQPTPVHSFLARVPAAVRALSPRPTFPLIVTTNYDDLLETALDAAEEPFDFVFYVAQGRNSGVFRHRRPGEASVAIDRPNTYLAASLAERPVVLKIHGAADRSDQERRSYVVTEDDYIEYLSRTDAANLLPVTLVAALRNSHILFLGHGLRDWNLRVVLQRIWGGQSFSEYNSWAVQRNSDPLQKKYWSKRDVEIFDVDLDAYVDLLNKHL
jgi:hypothetical protein